MEVTHADLRAFTMLHQWHDVPLDDAHEHGTVVLQPSSS